MLLQRLSLTLVFFLTLQHLPCHGSVKTPSKKSSNETTERRLLLVISLSGLNAVDPDHFSMPNLMHLHSHASYPSFFLPQYPGTSAPNLFSIATGMFPDNHGVLADMVYDTKQKKILTEKDPEYFTQNPNAIPIWTLNELNGGVSACLMWPGCEVPFRGQKPTYHVPYTGSYTFTDLVDLIVSTASAKFPKEDYEKYIAKRTSGTAFDATSGMLKGGDDQGMNKTNPSGNKAGDVEQITESLEHNSNKSVDETVLHAMEEMTNKAGVEDTVETVHDRGTKSDVEDTVETVNDTGSKTGEEASMKTVHEGGNKTGDKDMKSVNDSANNTTAGQMTKTAVKESKNTDINDMKVVKDRSNKTDLDDMKTMEDKAIESGVQDMNTVENVGKNDGEEDRVNKTGVEMMKSGEHFMNESWDDKNKLGMKHLGNETVKRSVRDLHSHPKYRDVSWKVPDWWRPYTAEREEKYKVVNITTETANYKIKNIIDLHDQTLENDHNRLLFETFDEAANRSSVGNDSVMWHPYPFFKRLARTRVMYTLQDRARANLVMVRFNEPDRTARRFGPNSPQMMAALHTLDTSLLYLHLQLQRHNLQHNTDLLLLSEHGTTPIGFFPADALASLQSRTSGSHLSKGTKDLNKAFIDLDSILDPSLYKTSGETPLLHIWPIPGKHAEVNGLLSSAAAKNNFTVHDSRNLDYDAYHFSKNPRISKILLEADPGYAFSDKVGEQALAGPWESKTSEGMPLMLAAGPSFKENYEGYTIQNVDLYPLMIKLLGIPQGPPVDGSLIAISFILKPMQLINYNSPWIFAVLTLIILVLLVLLISCCFRKSKRPPKPQRMSTIYRTTVEPNSFVEYDVQVMASPRGNNRSTSAPDTVDRVDGEQHPLTPARRGKGKQTRAPAPPSKEEELREENTDELSQLLQTKASGENSK